MATRARCSRVRRLPRPRTTARAPSRCAVPMSPRLRSPREARVLHGPDSVASYVAILDLRVQFLQATDRSVMIFHTTREPTMSHSELVEYRDGNVICETYVARPEGVVTAPCVLIAHDWSGRLAHMEQKADELAAEGFVGVAIDVYGRGNRGDVNADNSALMNPFLADRGRLLARLQSALEVAAVLPGVDPGRIGIMGYCFGGLCALDLARGADPRLKAAVSIHGMLFRPPGPSAAMTASVLVLHGWNDPLAQPSAVLDLASELTAAGADWQLHAYGHAMHAFTVQGLNRPNEGLAYHPRAASRADVACRTFLREILGS
jgi:dienelactone hydrolase